MTEQDFDFMTGFGNPAPIPEKELQPILNEMENPAPIKDEAQYAKYRKLSSGLCSLEVATFNRKHPLNDQVRRLEGAYNKRLAQWMKKTRLIKDPFVKLLGKYLVMSKYFPTYDEARFLEPVADELLAKGWLFRSDDRVVVAGFEYKLGDNVFSVDRMGREHRQYVSSAAPLALPLDYSKSEKLASWIASHEIPALPEEYKVAFVGDGKFCVRSPRFSQEDQGTMIRFFQSQRNR